MPPAPWWIQPLLIPIEFFQNFILRPVTLAVRLFANMFAGHVILLVFTLGGFALWRATVLARRRSRGVLGDGDRADLLRGLVVVVQAYVFTLLTAIYVQGSLADEH